MTLRNGQSNGSIRAWRRHFPLNSVDDVVNLIREFILDAGIQPSPRPLHPPLFPSSAELLKPDENTPPELSEFRGKEPNLAFVSIILGYIENYLTMPTQDPLSTRKFRGNTALGTRLSPINSVSSSKVISPSPLSVQVDISCSEADQFPHTVISPSDASPLSTISSPTTATNVQLSIRKARRPRHFSGSNGTSRRSRRARHTSSSSPVHSVGDGNELASRPESPCSLPSLLAMDSATAKRRRLSETSLSSSLTSSRVDKFPRLTFDDMEQLYREFYNLIVTSPLLSSYQVDVSTPDRQSSVNRAIRWATRDLIRAVLQALWSRMVGAGRGRDRLTHTQSVYSFLTSGLLDSFGLAYTIVAACQLLGYSDVDLALSEDHGWVEFGPPGDRQTADVASWVHQRQQQQQQFLHQQQQQHGQQQHQQQDNQWQQLRLPGIREPPLQSSWLYVNGQPVICRPRLVAMAAAVTAMQPGGVQDLLAPSLLTASTRIPLADGGNALLAETPSNTPVSYQLVHLKHRLLWLMYASGCLTRYPLGLTNLADLEDTFPTGNETGCVTESSPTARQETSAASVWPLALYTQAVLVNQRHYNNQHVYPYTCLAGCFYRRNCGQETLRNWCEAACVIGQYKHSSEDLEVYRELLEIATTWMPQMFRSAAEAARSCSEGLVEADPDGCLYQPHNILDSPQCLAHLISFYDHLCLWEESASVPVLHVGWVDKLMVNLTRFSQRARRHLHFDVAAAAAASHTPTTPAASVAVAAASGNLSSRCRSRTASMRPLSVDTSMAATGGSHLPPLAGQSSPMRLRRGSVHSSQASLVKSMSPGADYSRTLTVCGSPLSVELGSTIKTSATPNSPFCPDKEEHTPTEVLLVSATPHPVDDTWHLLPTSGTEIPSPTRLLSPDPVTMVKSTEATAVGSGLPTSTNGGDDDASPSPPPLSIFPGEEEADDTEELLSSLAEACGRRLLNPAFLSGSEPNVPFLPGDCELDEVFARLVASWNAENSNRQAVAVKSSPDIPTSTTATEGNGTSIFPTPPSSGGIVEPQNLVALLPGPQPPQTLEVEALAQHYLPDTKKNLVHESALNDAEDAVAIDLFQDLLESVSGGTSAAEPACTDKCSALAEGDLKEPPSKPAASKSVEDLAVHLSLRSIKMASIVELLRAPRLNSSAIKLALTAQSQVSLRRTSATGAAVTSPYAV